MNYLQRHAFGRKCKTLVALFVTVIIFEQIIKQSGIFSGLFNVTVALQRRNKMVQSFTRQQPMTHNELIINNATNKWFISNASHNTNIVIFNRSKKMSEQHVVDGNVSSKVNPVFVFTATGEEHFNKETVIPDRCVRFKSNRNNSVICVYRPEEDAPVSGTIQQTGSWETELLNMTRELYAAEPGLQLLDLGCHVGVYTLTAALLGHTTVAVDANINNLRLLSRSLTLNDLHNKVMLFWNAVSDAYEKVELGLTAGNVGGTVIKPRADGTSAVSTIKMDNLIHVFKGKPAIIKMDIEGSEWKALNGARRFFEEVDVRYVLMEYVFHIANKSGILIREFFDNFGFLPFKAPMHHIGLDLYNDSELSGNVLWIKQRKKH